TERVVTWMQAHHPAIVYITGGAPELNPHVRFLVKAARAWGAKVIDRNNLTILSEPGYEDLPAFLAENEVEIIASLPCYQPENVRKQRGDGVFERSITGLQKLNAVGYGTKLPLHLVYNPVGPALPPPQVELEQDYKEALGRDYGIVFHQLFTIANQPIARFAEDLRKQGRWEEYMELLVNSFNPATIEGLMCRNTLSVGFQGEVYDCDFNQMLNLRLHSPQPLFLWDVTSASLENSAILTGNHCLACTAGCGSSCTGALTE
ncbi:MAG: Radical domain protein, partial [Verrucomicrobia bacterium]|nr:Radical domain protein [Verrucomicrobiota bacterium]